jgi:hypothetical protein
VVHNCRCSLSILPPGGGFDAQGQLVYIGTKKSVTVESLDKALLGHDCSEE